MLCGSTSRAESNDIFSRLANPPANPEHGIKLCYVTVRIDFLSAILDLLNNFYSQKK
jgi:hypothetical protein